MKHSQNTANMEQAGLIFPHQLFKNNPLVTNCDIIYLVEEQLLFRQFKFHKQKIAFHRAGMKFYESYLAGKGMDVVYIESPDELSDIRNLIPWLKEKGIERLVYIDPTDNWLSKRVKEVCYRHNITTAELRSPMFLNSKQEIEDHFAGKKQFFQTDFYISQRKKRNILLEAGQQPIGGKWSFDAENRLKYPKDRRPPQVSCPPSNKFYTEAATYTEKYFSGNYGELNSGFNYPCTFEESKIWLDNFLQTRFAEFGAYEDAVVAEQHILHHSVLSPLLNSGLLQPGDIIDEALETASKNDIPINSLEGFIRQIAGWREYMRAVYELRGTEERTRNYWGFKRKIPYSFWEGSTGIGPVDNTIRKVLKTGYCHHIERLMILGNFMLLCEFDPDEVYHWFMELFIDAYDWVMVPNVYGMSQFADGGMMSTKPYISGSNYVLKMSDYKKGDWQNTWDGLFWRFMHVHRDFFKSNPRLGMLIISFDKMPVTKQKMHLDHAEIFLRTLDHAD